ncbi:hypothetical protein ACOMHN_014248 [Nucella lapillus]
MGTENTRGKTSARSVDWGRAEQLAGDLSDLIGVHPVKDEQACFLMKRIYHFRQSSIRVLTAMRFTQSAITSGIDHARRSNTTNAEFNSTFGDILLEEILDNISWQIEGGYAKFHAADPEVAEAMNLMSRYVDFIEQDQQLWTVSQLEHHASFVLLSEAETLDAFHDLLDKLLRLYVDDEEVNHFLGLEDSYLEFRWQERAQFSNTALYKIEEMYRKWQ